MTTNPTTVYDGRSPHVLAPATVTLKEEFMLKRKVAMLEEFLKYGSLFVYQKILFF